MRRFLSIGLFAVSLWIGLTGSALAQTQITIGQSTSGSVEFAPSETAATMGGALQGNTFIGSNAGTYSTAIGTQGNNIGVVAPAHGGTPTTFATISSGELLRAGASAPEPASIALIGSGLLALGGALKRRKKR